MLDKLADVEKRFEQVSEMLYDADVISDIEKYKSLMKEHKNLEPIVEKYREYKKASESFEEAKLMLDEGGLDKDMREMVLEEIEVSKENMQNLYCSCRKTLTMIKTLLLKSEAARAAKNPHCLLLCFTECIPCMPKAEIGKPK